MSAATSLITQVSMLSVPVDFEFFRDFITFRTSSGSTVFKARLHCLCLVDSLSLAKGSVLDAGIPFLSLVTLSMKNEFIVPANPAGELTSLPLWKSCEGGPELFQFNQVLTFFHNVLGLCLVLLHLFPSFLFLPHPGSCCVSQGLVKPPVINIFGLGCS